MAPVNIPKMSHDDIVSIEPKPAMATPATIQSTTPRDGRFSAYNTMKRINTCVKNPLSGLTAAATNGNDAETGARLPQDGLIDGMRCLANATPPAMTKATDAPA